MAVGWPRSRPALPPKPPAVRAARRRGPRHLALPRAGGYEAATGRTLPSEPRPLDGCSRHEAHSDRIATIKRRPGTLSLSRSLSYACPILHKIDSRDISILSKTI